MGRPSVGSLRASKPSSASCAVSQSAARSQSGKCSGCAEIEGNADKLEQTVERALLGGVERGEDVFEGGHRGSEHGEKQTCLIAGQAKPSRRGDKSRARSLSAPSSQGAAQTSLWASEAGDVAAVLISREISVQDHQGGKSIANFFREEN